MIKKTTHLIIIIAFLIAVCWWEEIAFNNYFGQINAQVKIMQTNVIAGESIDSVDMLFSIENLEEIWQKKENAFCIIINHEQVEVIGVEIAKLKAAIINNDKDEFNIGLSTINFYIENLSHILGLSMQNLF